MKARTKVSTHRTHLGALASAAALSLFAATGCAPDEATASEPLQLAERRPDVALPPLPHLGMGTAFSDTPRVNPGLNRITDPVMVPDAPARFDDSVPAVLRVEPAQGVFDSTLGTWFNVDAFQNTVDRVATEHDVRAAALPTLAIGNPGEARDLVQGLVAWSSGVEPMMVRADPAQCGYGDEGDCARAFLYTLHGTDGAFAQAVTPAIHRLASAARDLETTVWTPTRGREDLPDAVTLHGRVEGRLVGLIVFR